MSFYRRRHQAFITSADLEPSSPVPSYVEAKSTFTGIAIKYDLDDLGQLDSDKDSTFSVYYRVKGTSTWNVSLPPMRAWSSMVVQTGTLGEDFWAASIIDLTDNTTYQIKTVFLDPDVGTTVTDIFDVGTKTYLVEGTNTLYVSSTGSSGDGSYGNPYSVSEALAVASPGDTFVFQDGTYGRFTLSTSGTAANPITWKAENIHLAIIDDTSGTEHCIQVSSSNTVNVDYQIIDGFKLIDSQNGIKIRASKFLEVKNCDIITSGTDGGGIYCWQTTYPENYSDLYFHNNRITGSRAYSGGTADDDYAIRLQGDNCVTSYNTVENYSNGISFNAIGNNCDIHNNDCYEVYDPLEFDGTYNNLRAYRNRMFNIRNGCSVQELYGGPAYIFLNLIFNLESNGIKRGNGDPCNIFFCHNTVVGGNQTTTDSILGVNWGIDNDWTNSMVKNNAVIGVDQIVVNEGFRGTDSIDDWSYNGFYTTAGTYAEWDGTSYSSLANWESGESAVHDNFAIAWSDFETASQPSDKYGTYDPDDYDFRPSTGSNLIGAADSLGNLNKEDVGCYEQGEAIPTYGWGEIIGYTSIYTTTSTNANRTAVPAVVGITGDIISLTIYHDGGTGDVILGVYDDNSGTPLNKLGQTNSTAIKASAGWQTISLQSPVAVTIGETVWLAWVFENNPGVKYDAGTPGRHRSDSGVWAGGMPSTWGSSGQTDFVYSMYATMLT